jgi:hypothetical protein
MKLFLTATVLASAALLVQGAEIESRALTQYLAQDFLEEIVRKEGWTEIVLKPYGGIRKGDIVRIWSGGVVDYNNSNVPGEQFAAPCGIAGNNMEKFSLSADSKKAYALLFKSDEAVPYACNVAGKPLEVRMTKEGARVWLGYNDQKGQFHDNHLGRGRRHELDPLWVRVEVIRIVVD